MVAQSPELEMTLRDAVDEVLGQLTGLDLTYVPEYDRFRAITRALNKALRLNSLEKEWSYYSTDLDLGPATPGETMFHLPSGYRVRQVNDDAVRLVDETGCPVAWAYFLPRDALHKYRHRNELRASVTRSTVTFSRPLPQTAVHTHIEVPAMREPEMFRLPPPPEDVDDPVTPVPDDVLDQLVDFPYPDLITMRAAFLVAQSDPIMQPRVQTLEAQYKDLMYQAIERDDRITDTPFTNDFILPIQSGARPTYTRSHGHPHGAEWF